MTDPTAAIGDSAAAVLERPDDGPAPAGAADAAAQARARRHHGGARSRRGNAGGRKGGYKPTKAELERRLKEIEAERAASLDDDDTPTGIPVDQLAQQLVGPLAQSIRTSSGIVARILRAPWWELAPDECSQLSQAWAPVLAPQLAQHADKLPVLMALGVTVEVLMPRVERQLDAQRAQRAGVQVAPPPAAATAEASDAND